MGDPRLFLGGLAGHWIFAWYAFSEQAQHGQSPEVQELITQRTRDTLENWQSEFLQLVWQVTVSHCSTTLARRVQQFRSGNRLRRRVAHSCRTAATRSLRRSTSKCAIRSRSGMHLSFMRRRRPARRCCTQKTFPTVRFMDQCE
jgi:hypothetical protein